MDFSKIIVTLCIGMVFYFASEFLKAFLEVGHEPTALIAAVFGFITVELWSLAKITRTKINKEKEVEYEDKLETEIDE